MEEGLSATEAPTPKPTPKPTPTEKGYSLLTGTTIWLSMLPWDDAAVGLLGGADTSGNFPPDPEVLTDLIHPLNSGHSIKVFDSHVVELDEFSRNTPFQQGALEVPPDYFRSPMGPGLAALIDKQWEESFDDGPPEGETPPSASWDGNWYFYVACWWKVVGPPSVANAGADAGVEIPPPNNGGGSQAE